ncbi:MAG TPA: nucleotide disphospho-sugar-binding domain-containing protein [Pyrinomonadaceae bacterium]|nr:nucleotide disphospho-sugar-binding domain-containing protein [Pyrinomonadaceae bacterium]
MSTQGKRVVLSTFGSFGDIHPYVALALELRRRGHHPVLATSAVYREKADALGIELRPVRPDLPSPDDLEATRQLVSDLVDQRKGTERVFGLLMPHLREIYEDLLAAVEGADLLLTHPLPFVGPVVAQKTGIPWVSSVLAPISLFSAYDPPLLPQAPWLDPFMRLHPAVVRLFLLLGEPKFRSIFAPVHRLRRELGLPRGGTPILEGQHSPTLVLALFSKVLAAPQPDWPPNTVVTGFAFYDRRDRAGDAEGTDPALLEFLEAGEPPIIFTLGSSAFFAAGDFYRDSVAAARSLGRRALLLIGEERNRPASLPAGAAAFEYAPFSEVLPRAAAVVHQGGVGTTGQALRAGVPQLVVPFGHDQFDNGARVARGGCGRVLPRRRYDARRAERELRALLGDESYARRAARAGRVVRDEDGAVAAVDAIERVLKA